MRAMHTYIYTYIRAHTHKHTSSTLNTSRSLRATINHSLTRDCTIQVAEFDEERARAQCNGRLQPVFVFARGLSLSVSGPRHLGSSASMQVHHVVCAHIRILFGGIFILLRAILTSHAHSTDVRPFMAVIGDNRDGAALLRDGERDRHVTQRVLCQHRMHDPFCRATRLPRVSCSQATLAVSQRTAVLAQRVTLARCPTGMAARLQRCSRANMGACWLHVSPPIVVRSC